MPDGKIKGGYYIKARQIKDSWIRHAAPVIREVWDYLLREANHADVTYNKKTVKRGQLFRSYRQIREDLSWKVGYRTERYHMSAIKRAMGVLTNGPLNAPMNGPMIELTSEPRGNLITILNYDYYQNPKNYERTSERTTNEPVNEPMNGGSINKNDKNDKNDITTYSPDSPEFCLSQFLFDHIRKRNPKAKEPDFQKWTTHTDRLIRLDGRTPKEIAEVIRWCQMDDFWQNNILSTEKLRKQFDQLYLKMKSNGKKPTGDWRQRQNVQAAKEFMEDSYGPTG